MHRNYRQMLTCIDARHGTSSGILSQLPWAGVRMWLHRSRQRRALAELDDRMLRDIGVTHSQARREAARPFWSAGKA